MVLVEGLKMKTKRIPKRHLTAAWETLSSKPFPKVKALKLSDDDFSHVLHHRHCIEDDFREIEEWGRFFQPRVRMPVFLMAMKLTTPITSS